MIKPLPGYVLIEPIEEERKEGAVYLPESSKDKPMKGKVIDCGDNLPFTYDKHHVEGLVCPVKQGETIYHKKWVNETIKYEGKEYLLVHFNELLAVIE